MVNSDSKKGGAGEVRILRRPGLKAVPVTTVSDPRALEVIAKLGLNVK